MIATEAPAKFAWTDDRVETLKRLRIAGMSGAGIAARIGNGCTRNAVIGKSHRLGLYLRSKPSAAPLARSQPKPIAPAVKAAAKPAPPATPKPASVALPPAETIPRFSCFDPGARPTIGLDDLKACTCRWPFGDRESYRFCGAPTTDVKSSWCAEHAARAFTASKARAA